MMERTRRIQRTPEGSHILSVTNVRHETKHPFFFTLQLVKRKEWYRSYIRRRPSPETLRLIDAFSPAPNISLAVANGHSGW